MEAAEVTVAMAFPGDAGMLKDEEAESSDKEAEPRDKEAGPRDKEAEPRDKEAERSDKTPVILHLQPILHGLKNSHSENDVDSVALFRINDDIADTGTTVLAIETHHEDDDMEGDEVEYGYPITCGDSRAVLLFKKFVCPGINVRCVKFKQQLISPKQFVHLAGKATLKDWKRAIRLGGVMLRKMMDSGQIDFYQHDTVCTNTCRSTKFDLMVNSSRLPPAGGSSVLHSPPSLTAEPAGGQLAPMAGGEVVIVDHPPEERVSDTEEWSHGPPPPTSTNGHVHKKKRADMSDMLALWRAVAEEGLMGDVLSSIHTEMLSALTGVERRAEHCSLNHTDVFILSSLCETFGLLDSVKRAVEQRHTHLLEKSLGEQQEKDYYYVEERGNYDQSPSHKTNYGQSPSHKTNYGQSPSHKTNYGQSPSHKTNYGQSPSHKTNYGQSPSHKTASSKRPRLHRHSAPTGQTRNISRPGSVHPLTASPPVSPRAEPNPCPQRHRRCSVSGDGPSAALEAWERLHRLGQERGEGDVDWGTRGSRREDRPDPRPPPPGQNEDWLGSEPGGPGKKGVKRHKTNRAVGLNLFRPGPHKINHI